MTASSRGSRAAASLIQTPRHPRLCSECISHRASSTRRSYAVAAASLKTADGIPNSYNPHIAAIPPVTSSPYTTKAGILLSRPPLLTRPQTSFERAFFFYQKRLNERLAMPFTRYFYFKKDTPANADWKIKVKERNGVAARELGGYDAYGEMGWNDEILQKEGDMTSLKYVQETLIKDAKVRAVEGKDGVAVPVEEKGDEAEGTKIDLPLSRWTEADKTRDVRRLDRQLGRTLYLVVKRQGGGWGFPSGELVGRENLHQAAERVLVQTAGLNMNTWVVGHAPIGHHVSRPYINKEDSSVIRPGEKTFFMKARIMAGQANLKDNKYGLEDFKWLTKEEVAKHVADKYFSSVRNMMGDR